MKKNKKNWQMQNIPDCHGQHTHKGDADQTSDCVQLCNKKAQLTIQNQSAHKYSVDQ